MPALAVSMGARTASGMFAGEFVEVGLQLAWGELFARLDLFTTIPPVSIIVVKNVLRGWVGLADVGLFFLRISGYGLAFFLTAVSWSLSLGSVISSPSPHSDVTCSIFSSSAFMLIWASAKGPRLRR